MQEIFFRKRLQDANFLIVTNYYLNMISKTLRNLILCHKKTQPPSFTRITVFNYYLPG